MNTDNIILPELLAPAGSSESAAAAVAAGADAIYFGGERFSARARAKNLSAGEIDECMRMCRAHGVKAYGAINTRLRDSELSDAVESAYNMLCAGADALIIADLGLAELLKSTFPTAVLHASTQISGTSSADAAVLAELGFSRMVCPRELSLPELRTLAEKSPIGIEMFIHGAHCVCVSGQCSMSYVMGGRSGNRGDCAGPCRLPFGAGLGRGRTEKTDGYAISLKDMCLAEHIRQIIDSGAESLKIEGRLKGPEYTYGVVSVYRTLLDEKRDAHPDEVAKLSEYFSRDGFSDGYIRNRYKNMLGTKKDSERRQAKTTVIPDPEKIPVRGNVRLYCGEAAKLTLTSHMGTVFVEGDVLTAATGNPPTNESLIRSLSKLGQTPFIMESMTVDTDGMCGIAASALNALRREAVEKLLAPAPPVLRKKFTISVPDKCTVPKKAIRAVTLSSADQLTVTVTEYFDEIYIPFGDYINSSILSEKVGVSLPDVLYEGFNDDVYHAVARAASEKRKVLVHTLGELLMAVKAGTKTICSHRFVVYNSGTATMLRRMGAECITISPEISAGTAKSMSAISPTAVLTGGRMPLMLCRRCPMSNGGRSCRMGRTGGFDGNIKPAVCRGYLTDRTGAILPSVGDRYCMTTVFNSVPTWTELSEKTAAMSGITRMMHIFASETPQECDEAVRMLRSGKAPKEYRKLR